MVSYFIFDPFFLLVYFLHLLLKHTRRQSSAFLTIRYEL